MLADICRLGGHVARFGWAPSVAPASFVKHSSTRAAHAATRLKALIMSAKDIFEPKEMDRTQRYQRLSKHVVQFITIHCH